MTCTCEFGYYTARLDFGIAVVEFKVLIKKLSFTEECQISSFGGPISSSFYFMFGSFLHDKGAFFLALFCHHTFFFFGVEGVI